MVYKRARDCYTAITVLQRPDLRVFLCLEFNEDVTCG